jgi:hypothetical protein
VLSDYIKVIPGNYLLSLYIRLENVVPQRSRLGTRLFDGVSVNLQFFDRNKIPLKPHIYSPHLNQVVDVSFKSLSFANYQSITAFGWGKVIGKSHYFPFPEGDIPSAAHYVKIFIGLKGRGTMWIDSVDFRYTGQNFSVSEKMQKYTDTLFHTPIVVLPTPQKMTEMESVLLFKPGMDPDQLPVVVVPDNMDELGMKAARLIQQTLQKYIQAYDTGNQNLRIRLIRAGTSRQLDSSSLVISVGRTSWFKSLYHSLPVQEIADHPQGYFIHTDTDNTNLLILGANNSQGLYYAALTAIQLIDELAPVFHKARIVDYPDFPGRYFSLIGPNNHQEPPGQPRFIEDLVNYKLNGAFVPDYSKIMTGAVFSSDTLLLYKREGLLDLLPLNDYAVPEDSVLTYANSVYAGLDVFKKERQQENQLIVPPAFNNQLLDNSLCSGEWPDRSGSDYLYSGCSFFSILTDEADIYRFTSVTGVKPVFMDNSMNIATPWGQYKGAKPGFPGKIRMYNLFEPFANEGIREFLHELNHEVYFMNFAPTSEIECIRMATAADFLWNVHAYSGDYSLWKVLMTRYGKENARKLIEFADKYSLMLEIVQRFEMNNLSSRNIKTGQQTIADINVLIKQISNSLGSKHNLVQELHILTTTLTNNFNTCVLAYQTNN